MNKPGLAPAVAASLDAPKTRICADKVGVRYGDFSALRNADLLIPDRSIAALIGPSGCGKSTFLRCLNRMNDLIDGAKVSGKILLDGADIYDRHVDAAELRRKVGMVFQKPNPFPMSIYDNVAYGPRLHSPFTRSELNDLVERCLTRAALWDEVKDKLKQSALALSGGQQQRLCIARALATNPEVLLMDEPCSALDPISTERIETLMRELRDSLAIVIVTHNMGQAQRVADTTAFFYKGELLESGSTSTIFGSPKKQETDDYVHGRFG